jgi:uncharacterized membrane protein
LIRKIAWVLMALLACFIAAYAFAILFLPNLRPPFLQQRFLMMPVAAALHLAASGVALAVGPLQHNSRIRGGFLNLHRWLGRVYVIAVMLGGSAALSLATVSQGGLPTHVGFGLLAVLWLGATAVAYRQIRRGDRTSHRRWMVRSYALTFAAVTLRIYLPLSIAAGLAFEPAYQTIAWLCWVPNLVIAEWLLLRPQTVDVISERRSVIAV